ncbi:MAG: HAMP domain-containing sensor histidine kinase [Eubacteriales bacterium]|nr:HAMP domain-containing sensor histidine kinase [Eubacteriales bacterium]
MKERSMIRQILLPAVIVLFLIPPLSCLIFMRAVHQYAFTEAERDLAALRKNVLPLAREALTGEARQEKTPRERNSDFLRKIGMTVQRMGGNARLLIFSQDLQLVYPQEETERELAETVAKACAEELGAGTESGEEGKMVRLSVLDGGDFLAEIYQMPAPSKRLSYLVTYCPTDQISAWTRSAAFMVLFISGFFAAASLGALFLAVGRIKKPIKRLCAEAERIGGGNFEEIEPPFRLKELEQLRGSMNGMARQLHQAGETQQTFFQNISHDLRTPLMSIGSYAQGIEQGVFPDNAAAARTILEESSRLTRLVNEILTLSRLETNFAERDPVPVSVADLAEDSLDRIYGLAHKNGIRLSLEPFCEKLTVMGDGELLSQALDNLLSNAVRYAKTAVTVRVETKEETVSILVSDDGEGITKEDMPHLFERCYKGKGGNFGLGLAIARTAVRNMGGELTADNRLEGGAVFTLTLKRGR